MTKKLYIAGIVVSSLLILEGLTFLTVNFYPERFTVTLRFLFLFCCLLTITSLVNFILLLIYYARRKFWFPFSVGAFLSILNPVQFLLVYFVVVQQVSMDSYILFSYITSAVAIVYGISLMVSKSGKIIWLKLLGLVTMLIQLGYVAAFIIGQSEFVSGFTISVSKIVSYAGVLLPILLILNFGQELLNLNKDSREELLDD